MEVTLTPGEAAPETPASQTAAVEPARKARIVLVAGSMMIEGESRATLTATVDGKEITWTPELTFFESWAIERWMDPRDLAGAGSGRVMSMATVRKINDDVQAFPASEVVIRDLVNRLGNRAAKFIWGQYFHNYQGADEAVKN